MKLKYIFMVFALLLSQANAEGPATKIQKTFVFDRQILLESANVIRVDFGEIIVLNSKAAKSYCEGLESCAVVRLGLDVQMANGKAKTIQNFISGVFQSESDARYWFDSLLTRVKYSGKVVRVKSSKDGSEIFHVFSPKIQFNFTSEDILLPELAGNARGTDFKLITDIFSSQAVTGGLSDSDARLPLVDAEINSDVDRSFTGYTTYFVNQILIVANPQ
ncbi:MAG: hypothetical protein J0L93_07180 [Deltaproteobacteria bacterium]|nr:hypothetical protein [Deltaproteobacteria bacterium]